MEAPESCELEGLESLLGCLSLCSKAFGDRHRESLVSIVAHNGC